MKLRLSNILTLIAAVVMLSACSTTSRIASDEQLYDGIKSLKIIPEEGQKVPAGMADEITEAVAVTPNNPYPFTNIRSFLPIGLWVYNHWYKYDKGLKHWLYDKLATDPVLISDVRPDLRTKMIDEILDNNGYFRATTDYTLTSGRNKKIAAVTYTVNAGPQFRFSSVELPPDTCVLYHVIDSVASTIRYLRPGQRYSVDSLIDVRQRISDVVRNRGFYFFSPEYIEYLADTVAVPGSVALRLNIAANAPSYALDRYKVGDVTLRLNRNQGGGEPDTFATRRATTIQMRPSRFRRGLVDECVVLRKGRNISQRAINSTQTRLSRLGIFSGINIQIKPDTLNRSSRNLNVDIDCTFDSPLEAKIEANVSSKSNSYLGPGLTLGLTNRNIFGGGEQLAVTLTGSYEWQTGRQRSSVFNSYEVNLQGSLSFPRLLAPSFLPRLRRDLSWTRITLNADLLNRPHYFRMAQFNASYSYDWQPSRHSTNTFTPLKFTYTKLLNTTAVFDSIMDANQAIAQSFMSQFLPQIQYTYTYDRQFDSRNKLNWTISVQEAGAIFCGIWRLTGVKGEKTMFGIPISQFVKASTQVVYGHRLGHYDSWLMWRVAVGAAHAYGNSSQVPYSEQFWVGGANSVRAFTVRTVGPGSYHDYNASSGNYFDQTGTFKFEANMEWRFPLVGPLFGALFVDAGNVWLLKDDPQRPGGTLRASSFLRDLALGTGAGLRFDMGMIVVRGDLGIGIHAPWDTGRSGYYNMTSFGRSLAFHLAIGYPF